MFQAYEACQTSAKDKEAEVAAVKKDMDALQKVVDKIKAVEVDIDLQLEDYNVMLRDHQKITKHWKVKVAELNEQHAQDLQDWGELTDPDAEDADDEAAATPATNDDDEEDKAEEGEEGSEANKMGDDDEDGAEAASSSSSAASAAAADDKEDEDEEEPTSKRRGGKRAASSSSSVAAGSKKASGNKGLAAGGGAAVVLLKVFTPEQLARYDKESLKYEAALLEEERDKLTKSVNMGAIAEYRAKQGEYTERFGDLEESTERRDEKRGVYEELRRQRLDEFMDGFAHITLKLKEMYQMITLGGDAELELVDSLDPFSEGIVFSVRPPKKSWKNIANLSGGEKTLSSLALVRKKRQTASSKLAGIESVSEPCCNFALRV